MPLLNTMLKRLNTRISNAQAPYDQFIFLADVHYKAKSANKGFEKILMQINKKEKNKTLFILIGGDLIDKGSIANYKAFVTRCNKFYKDTGIPIIPTMGNHEFYGVSANTDEISRYKKYIGEINFSLEISKKGLKDSLTIVAFNDAKPHKLEKITYPNLSKNCANKVNTKHLFYFPHNYIKFSSLAPEKYSKFPEYLNNSKGNHIIVTMHVPPRKNPLSNMINKFIKEEYTQCLKVNPVITLKNLQNYYRNLWMLVHGNSTPDINNSTQWFIDDIKNRKKVELVLMGHVHTYYPFKLKEANHKLQMVISGGGGNNSARTYSSAHPVTKYHYMRIKYNSKSNRFVYRKVNAGN